MIEGQAYIESISHVEEGGNLFVRLRPRLVDVVERVAQCCDVAVSIVVRSDEVAQLNDHVCGLHMTEPAVQRHGTILVVVLVGSVQSGRVVSGRQLDAVRRWIVVDGQVLKAHTHFIIAELNAPRFHKHIL